MTLLSPSPARLRAVHSSTLTTDVDALLNLAEQLNGLPVPNVRMTEVQFIDWQPKGIRAEWENGQVILMMSPNGVHADLNGWLFSLVREFVENGDLGLVRIPFSVRLAQQKRMREPDIQFVSTRRLSIVRSNYLDGPPDLAVEIASPDSVVRDWRTKYNEYEQAGVTEYWVVDPMLQRFDLYVLKAKKYQLQPIDDAGRVHSKALKGLHIKPTWLWRKPLPKLAPLFKELRLR